MVDLVLLLGIIGVAIPLIIQFFLMSFRIRPAWIGYVLITISLLVFIGLMFYKGIF